jgi:hypothetical protein
MKIILKPNAEHLRRMREIGPKLKADLSMNDKGLLRELGATHRYQMAGIFESEGGQGAMGKWSPLNPRYAERKRKLVGVRRILELTTDMDRRFTDRNSYWYVERFIPTSETLGLFQFGARSSVASAHLHGDPSLAPQQSAIARRVFGGRAQRLPVRDMITKTAAHMGQLRDTLRDWFVVKLRQRARGQAALGAAR